MEGEGRPEGKREGGRKIEEGNICHGMHEHAHCAALFMTTYLCVLTTSVTILPTPKHYV